MGGGFGRHVRERSEGRLDNSRKNDVAMIGSARRHDLNEARKDPVEMSVEILTEVACEVDHEVEKWRCSECIGLCQRCQQ
jgi:hypothetical protein